MKTALFVVAASILTLANPARLAAQDSRGRIRGRVIDATGAIVPGVGVKATNSETGVALSGPSNEQGNFEIPFIPPGTYNLSAELKGFKTYQRAGLQVQAEDELSIEIRMEPGQITESITVSAETPLLDTSVSQGQLVDNRRITELPLPSSNPFTLTVLAPGIINLTAANHPNTSASVDTVSNFGSNGIRDHNSDFSIDGASSMWGRNASFVPPPELVGEFKVETARFDATSRAPGAAINVALKSGTNRLHGSLSEYHNDNALQALDFFQRRYLFDPSSGPITAEKREQANPKHVMNRFGATLGGPVLIPKLYNGRNRTFWIYGFEGFARPSNERGNYYFTVPTVRERQGDFSELLAVRGAYQIYDPATTTPAANGRDSRLPFAGNIVPQSRIDPMARHFMDYWPLPNIQGTVDGQKNYFRLPRTYNEYFSHTARIDHVISPNHRIFARYNQAHNLYDSGQDLPNISTGEHRNRYVHGFGFDDVYIINPRLLVNFRYSLSRFVQTFLPYGFDYDLAGAGFPASLIAQIPEPAVTFPQLAMTGYHDLGTSYPHGTYSNYHTWAGDFTKIQGSHSFRFGGEFRLYRESNQPWTQATPLINFGTAWTRGPMDNSAAAPMGQDLATFLLGLPTDGNIRVNNSYAQQSMYSGWFFQDEYKVTPKLTVNLGLRYEFETAPTERYNRSVRGFDATVVNPLQDQVARQYAASPIPEIPVASFRLMGGLTFVGQDGQPRSLWATDHNNFAPRIGLAYRLPRSTVVRAGYGIYFLGQGVDLIDVNQMGFSQDTALVPSLDNGQTFIATFSNPFPNGLQQPTPVGLTTGVGQAITYFPARKPHGYAQRWNFTIQKQLPGRLLFETAYVGTRGTRLDVTRNCDTTRRQYLSTSPTRDTAAINFLSAQVTSPFYPLLLGTSVAGKTTTRLQMLRPYPEFVGVSGSDPVGYSWYHALQLRVERRFRSGFTVQGHYTFSKYMEAMSFLNPTDPMPEKVIADQDRPHRMVASGIYELPFGRGRHFGSNLRAPFDQVAGGWQISAVYQAQSGAPLSFGNVLYYGDIHDIALPADKQTVDAFFNTSGFETASGKQLGQNIRAFPSNLSGPRTKGINLWNVSAIKNFQLREGLRLQFRTEWLNATNHTHFNAPNTTPTSTQFGMVTGTGAYPRQIYFALKLLF